VYASQDAKELPPTHAMMEDEALDMGKFLGLLLPTFF
jgi:hypothetical protein